MGGQIRFWNFGKGPSSSCIAVLASGVSRQNVCLPVAVGPLSRRDEPLSRHCSCCSIGLAREGQRGRGRTRASEDTPSMHAHPALGAKAAIIQFAIDRAGPPIRRRVVSLSPPPENQQGDCGNRQAKSHGAAAMEPRADAAYREITGCEEQETAAADEFGGDQRAPAAGLRVLRHLVPYPAQHDSLETSLSKVRAASLRPSTVVR